ncbi:TrbI F-type domain-containing protein [Novosphingobium sp. Fuku2-ISO-50]|uniref:TrbI F-type domain-containing protein n=1 Tax=Novosphingobium sp. Fuku2-ISO-50 TaxID=1739114 RepID=UPI000A44DD44|nr:TrbI F-type domain-containing protein [Novosphingobium sp. Fuku2-ISO-50]
MLRPVALVMAVSGALLWGVWATHTILTLRRSTPHLVKVELADLMREYVQREARSGEAAEALTARTASFLKALNTAVGAHARRGDVVLLGNAVVDGDIPDITARVRAEVYAHQTRAAEPPHTPTDDKAGEREGSHDQDH